MTLLDKVLFTWCEIHPNLNNYPLHLVEFKTRVEVDETITVDVFCNGERIFYFAATDGWYAPKNSNLYHLHAIFQEARSRNARQRTIAEFLECS